MSLQTDLIFIRALRETPSVMKALDGRIYGTAIPLPDADADKVAIPYAVVMFDGLTNDLETKDEGLEGDEDTVTVGILLTAPTNEGIHTLSEAIRNAVRCFFEGVDSEDTEYDLVPESYQLKAGRIEYDPLKPCYYQELSYECTTKR